ncbi:MAG: ABC transporter permease subunit [Planctomycetota bacterium]
MSRPLVIAAGALFALLALAPILAMFSSIGASDLAGLLEPRTWSLLGRTVGLGLGVSALALLLGLPFGFLVARTDVPGATALRLLGVLPLFVPTLLTAMTWSEFSDVRGAPMAIWVLGLANFPLVAVFVARAAERIDERLEESARAVGGLRAVLRTDLGLVLPSALCGACLAFTFAVNDFAVPDYVSSVGPKFNVYADEIFSKWNQFERPGLAAATSLPLIAIALLALVPALALRRRGALGTLRGGFRPPQRIALGPWRWGAGAFALVVVGLSALTPLGRLVWEGSGGSWRWSAPSLEATLAGTELPTPNEITELELAGDLPEVGFGERLSAAPRVFVGQARQLGAAFGSALDRTRDDLRRSLTYAFGAACIAVALGFVLGHAIERARSRWVGRGLELASLLPLAAPATLFGIGAIVVWSRPLTADLYASEWMAPMLFAGRLTTFAVLILAGATASLAPELEEAAATSGMGPIKRLTGIVAPNLSGAMAGSWALVFAFAMRELDAGILVPAANRTAIVRVFNGVHFGRDDYVFALSLLLVFTIVLPGALWMLFSRRRLEMVP